MSNKALAAELQATLEEFRTRAIQAAWVGNVDGLTVEDNGNGVERVVKRRKVTIDQSEAGSRPLFTLFGYDSSTNSVISSIQPFPRMNCLELACWGFLLTVDVCRGKPSSFALVLSYRPSRWIDLAAFLSRPCGVV